MFARFSGLNSEWETLLEFNQRPSKLDVERRKYQPISEVEQWVGMIITAARQRFLALPRKVAPHVVGLDANQAAVVIEDAVREVLELMANEPWPEELRPNELETGKPSLATASS